MARKTKMAKLQLTNKQLGLASFARHHYERESENSDQLLLCFAGRNLTSKSHNINILSNWTTGVMWQ